MLFRSFSGSPFLVVYICWQQIVSQFHKTHWDSNPRQEGERQMQFAICHQDNNSVVADCKPRPGCLFSSYMAQQLNATSVASWHTTTATSNSLCNCLSTLELSCWHPNSVPCYYHHQFPNACHLVEMGVKKGSPMSSVICQVQFSSQYQSKSCYICPLYIVYPAHIWSALFPFLGILPVVHCMEFS